jgi:Flp pilus assembly pilin Flp
VSLLIRRPRRVGQAGQGLAEYALILALVGIAAIVAITFMGGAINNLLSTLGNAL